MQSRFILTSSSPEEGINLTTFDQSVEEQALRFASSANWDTVMTRSLTSFHFKSLTWLFSFATWLALSKRKYDTCSIGNGWSDFAFCGNTNPVQPYCPAWRNRHVQKDPLFPRSVFSWGVELEDSCPTLPFWIMAARLVSAISRGAEGALWLSGFPVPWCW